MIGPPGVPGAVPASETKGLEFDAVLVVEPERILADGPRGAAELYVALTRATQRLGVLHRGPLPRALSRTYPPAGGCATTIGLNPYRGVAAWAAVARPPAPSSAFRRTRWSRVPLPRRLRVR